MNAKISWLIVVAAAGFALGCSSSSNNAKADAAIAPDGAGPLQSAAKGDFTCRYFAKPDYTYTTSEVGTTRPNLPLDWDGKLYAMQLACAVWPDANYMWLNFFGFELDPNKPIDQLYRAELVIYMRTEDYKPGDLAVPARAPGWLTIAAGAKQTAKTLAAVWSGKVVLSKTPAQAKDEVTGSIDVGLAAFRDQPYGTECKLIDEFPAGTPPRQALLLSADCRSNNDCFPYFDGSGKGYCTRVCLQDGECTAHEPGSRCIRGTGSGVCLPDCATGGAAACKAINPAFDCHATEKVCYKP